jgi:pimeloyl-ACP methyl ester carboxylesterase
MMEPEIRYCTSGDGVSLAYYVMGEGETLVISSTVVWSNVRYVMTFLPEQQRVGMGIGRGMRVVRYDGRGAGLSDRSALDFTLETRLHDQEAVVAHAAPPRFTLIAVAQAALHAVPYAAQHPDRVSKLILVSPIVDGGAHRAHVQRWDSLRDMATAEWEDYTQTMAAANLGYDNPEKIKALALRMRCASHARLDESDCRAGLPCRGR